MDRSLHEAPPARQKKEDERKRAGWLAALLRGGSGAGVGGAGAVDGAVAGAAGSLLFAGKAGMIAAAALTAVGVVGGMAFLGYRSARTAALEKLSRERTPVFAQKPAEPGDDNVPSAGSADGASSSLSMLVAGNASRDYAAYAKSDVVTASMRPAAPEAAAPPASKNGADVSGNKAAVIAPAVQTVRVEAQGASGAAAAAAASGASPVTVLAAMAKSVTEGTQAPKGMAALGRQRAIGNHKFGASNALRALGLVRRDQAGAASSQAAGVTYDGSRPAAVTAALQAAIQGANAGSTSGAGATSSPLGAQAGTMTPPPPTPTGRNATPWQNAVNTAMMCIMGAAACLMIISKISFNPLLKPVVLILAGIAAMLSTVTVAMGSMLASGKYGQTFQGHMFTLAGGLMLSACAAAVIGMPATGGANPAAGAAAEESGSPSLWMVAAGGAALAAAMVGYMSHPKVVNDPYFKGGTPDWDGTGQPSTQYRAPSQDALARFLA